MDVRVLKDYSVKKTTAALHPKTGAKRPPRVMGLFTGRNLQWLVLGLAILSLLWVGIRTWQNRQSLRHNQRVLLLKQQQPVAVLLFQVEQKQVLVSDVRQLDLDRTALTQILTATAAAGRSHLVYNLLFTTNFDAVLEYEANSFDRESLQQAFAQLHPYYLFLKNPDVILREQTSTTILTLLGEQVFACPVALINTTGEVGLATTWAEILQNSSFSVIKKADNQDDLPHTRLVYDPAMTACQGLVDRLRHIVPGVEVIESRAQAQAHRAALVLYLGRDLADLYVFFVDLFHR